MRAKVQNLQISSSPLNSKTIPVALLLVSILFLSIVSGVLAAFGNVVLLIVLLALYGIVFVVAAPVAWTVWIIFGVVFLVSGPSAYFIRFTQLQWLTVLVSAALLLPLILHLLRDRKNVLYSSVSKDLLLPAFFLLIVIFSTLIDRPQFADFVNASRHYFLMWPLMLVFMFGLISEKVVERIWKALLIVAVIQFPMALYQYFFVSQKSTRLSPFDAVVGTFPGNISGGGDSAGMAILLLIAILIAIALWREKKLQGMWATVIILTGVSTLALAEVKLPVMLLPVVIGLYYRREILRRPVESITIVIAVIIIMSGILLMYEKLHYAGGSSSAFSTNRPPLTAYEHISRALDPDSESVQLGQKGRVSLVINWWEMNVKKGDIQHSLLGYGMGATHTSKIGTGELVDRFPYQINTTATVVLLWETGILGHLVFFLILLLGARASEQAAQHEAIPDIHRILLRVGSVGLLVLILMLPYKSVHLYSNPTQFLMMFMLGYAGYWTRFLKNNCLM
ncbi:hypothetical protein ABF87_05295 [Nitrosomonas sp. JL21]|uniref:hypothetical protein n=1 Tax=Nitrosomonas sp. JL21 TaxID=153949 RepID=UPI00136F9FD5|nr:hypothetical protein [Nitrosomonas sp. JL21]MBL8496342.1 hypothetical protein [Nitrosomonas sp.]MXS77384.1 hypothetical protein [Nitrosomonas sp. JL21]